jgi:hypothetical protein
LFGLLHKTRLHFIGVQYNTAEGKSGGVLLQGDKSNYRAILVALQGVTGAPVSVAEKEHGQIPIGVRTTPTTGVEQPGNLQPPAAPNVSQMPPATQPLANPEPLAEAVGTISLETDPSAADVYVDSQFYGNGPAMLKLKPGRHIVVVKMPGHKEWSREVSTGPGTEAHLIAILEKVGVSTNQ